MSTFPGCVRCSAPHIAGAVAGFVVTSVALVAAGGPFVGIQITSVRNGATVSGVVQLVASADDAGVTSVQFQLDGRALGTTITSGPCSITWDTRSAADGPHALGVFARDSRDTTLFAPDISVEVVNDQPRRARPR